MPYKLRGVAERKEGACPQVQMRIGQTVTCSIVTGTTAVRYFTGRIVETPDVNRAAATRSW